MPSVIAMPRSNSRRSRPVSKYGLHSTANRLTRSSTSAKVGSLFSITSLATSRRTERADRRLNDTPERLTHFTSGENSDALVPRRPMSGFPRACIMAKLSSLSRRDILARTSHDYCHRPIQTAAADRLLRMPRALSQDRTGLSQRERTNQQAFPLERKRLGGRRVPVGAHGGCQSVLHRAMARRDCAALRHEAADRVLRGLRGDRQSE